MIIFLLANTYIQHSIINYISLIWAVNISKVIVLEESFYSSDKNKAYPYELNSAKKIEEGILNSDETIIIPYGIPEPTILFVNNMCELFKKRFIVLTTESINQKVLHKFDNYNIKELDLYISKKPIIFILRFGKYSQITKMQLTINKILSDNNYNFGQVMCDEFTTYVDESLHMESIIHKKISELCKSENQTEFTVFTWPFDIILSLDLLDKYLKSLRPDYTIMCVENNFDKHTYMNNLFEFKFNMKIDKFVYSDYVSVKKNNQIDYLYVGNDLTNDSFCDIEQVLFLAIARITYPNGIVPV